MRYANRVASAAHVQVSSDVHRQPLPTSHHAFLQPE